MTDQVNDTGQAPVVTPPAGQAPADQQGQQGTGQEPGQQGTPPNDGTPDLSTITDPNLRAWVEAQAKAAKEARQEAARYRTERNALTAQQEQARQAALTDEQRAQEARAQEQAELERTRQELRDLKVGGAVKEAATAAQAFDPSVVWSLIKDAVQVDDKGQPTNTADLINGLKASHAFLFRRVSGDAGAGAGNGNTPALSMNDEIRRLAGRGN